MWSPIFVRIIPENNEQLWWGVRQSFRHLVKCYDKQNSTWVCMRFRNTKAIRPYVCLWYHSRGMTHVMKFGNEYNINMLTFCFNFYNYSWISTSRNRQIQFIAVNPIFQKKLCPLTSFVNRNLIEAFPCWFSCQEKIERAVICRSGLVKATKC